MNICIIGGGASSVLILNRILKKHHEFKNTEIVIYETRPAIGPGLAYNENNGYRILNTSPNKMSIGEDKYDYVSWCLDQNKNELLRKTYGKYLEYKFLEICKELHHHNIIVNAKHEEVRDIKIQEDKVCIKAVFSNSYYNIGIIASGGIINEPFSFLQKSDRYFSFLNFLDFDKILSNNAKTVGVIGTGQSAVDVSLMLQNKGYTGKIIMFSKKGVLPKVRPDNILTDDFNEELEKLINTNKTSLHDLIKFSTSNIEFGIADEYQDWKKFIKEIEESRKSLPRWNKLMNQFTPHIIQLWSKLSEKDKKIFKLKFLETTQRLRGGIPLFSGEKILKLISNEQLNVIKDINKIEILEDGFSIHHLEGEKFEVDFIINAAGISANGVFKIINGLLKNRNVLMSEYGGIEVDIATNQLIDHNHNAIKNLYAIGYPTKGVCQFVNSIEFLKTFADRIINSIIVEKNSKLKTVSENFI
ncbi:FAD/NAD(P)-binding protein [Aquimarina muelleri]|uniref:FAD-dependent urate hydroxylase HpyO/Asp monooxygenase CreE-like FAD/NAD(P)-binding domain-containing protein n=1 Tax=Aquimarina muelleri TaxID=279356 RepID=A0A918JTH7_9FLAO|nr:FAD/NAD(P)-binding protein [Aquimarina muelleri]MCX2762820.1 FAD/NAD(P)-binding protein [Aquimarina muelleri]GGX11707.1 hypothetical protein GCM10007384_11760 [Aquimarina muelleri]